MKLEDLAGGALPVPLALIGGDRELSLQVQLRLSEIGLLDPPADGSFGPVSHWALGAFLKRIGTPAKDRLDVEAARALQAGTAVELFPLQAADSLAGRIAAAALRRGAWLSRHPDCVNICYVEGMDPDGRANGNAPNEFNDLRVVLRVNEAGLPEIVESWDGTSEPGAYYVKVKKLDKHGAARIAFGQYKAWAVGTHNASSPSGHEALVQTAPIRVHRDLNEDFLRDGDTVFEGLFGVNQHWGFDMDKTNVHNASAGCLVGRTKAGHRAFMKLCKADPRYAANNGYRFMTTVMAAAEVTGA